MFKGRKKNLQYSTRAVVSCNFFMTGKLPQIQTEDFWLQKWQKCKFCSWLETALMLWRNAGKSMVVSINVLLFESSTLNSNSDWYLEVKLTVHLCGFSPVCLLMCTTSMYCALKGFSSLEQSFHRQTKAFLLLPIWSLLRCCKTEQA